VSSTISHGRLKMKIDDIKVGQEVKTYYRKESVYGIVTKKIENSSVCSIS